MTWRRRSLSTHTDTQSKNQQSCPYPALSPAKRSRTADKTEREDRDNTALTAQSSWRSGGLQLKENVLVHAIDCFLTTHRQRVRCVQQCVQMALPPRGGNLGIPPTRLLCLKAATVHSVYGQVRRRLRLPKRQTMPVDVCYQWNNRPTEVGARWRPWTEAPSERGLAAVGVMTLPEKGQITESRRCKHREASLAMQLKKDLHPLPTPPEKANLPMSTSAPHCRMLSS